MENSCLSFPCQENLELNREKPPNKIQMKIAKRKVNNSHGLGVIECEINGRELIRLHRNVFSYMYIR